MFSRKSLLSAYKVFTRDSSVSKVKFSTATRPQKYKALPYKPLSEELNEEDFDLLYSYLSIRNKPFDSSREWSEIIDGDCIALQEQIYPELSDEDLLRFKKRLNEAARNYKQRESAIKEKSELSQAEEDLKIAQIKVGEAVDGLKSKVVRAEEEFKRAHMQVQQAQARLDNATQKMKSLGEQKFTHIQYQEAQARLDDATKNLKNLKYQSLLRK